MDKWAKEKLGTHPREIKNTKNHLNSLLNDESNPYQSQEVSKLESKLEKLLSQEEMHWKQRSHNQWLRGGDRNTSFFYKMAFSRRKKNAIVSLHTPLHGLTNDLSCIEDHIIKYYEDLFRSQIPTMENIRLTTSCINTLDTNEMALRIPFTKKEVQSALFYLNPNKASGPDGFSASFFQKEWKVVGSDVLNTVLGILNKGDSLEGWNSTIITLIPKIKNPSNVKDYIPISLCNVLYKVVARAITNRLKNTLRNIIDPFQSAFIPDRAITDNILLGFECMYWLRHSKNKKDYAALKLDMSKAYNRVEWNYLDNILLRLGFCAEWVKLIMNCVKTIRYSFNINGKLVGDLTPSRGLRQGDPLSPYLFVLCSQGISSILEVSKTRDGLQGIKVVNSGLMITHLFFADDSLVFFKADKDNANRVYNCLRTYEKASG